MNDKSRSRSVGVLPFSYRLCQCPGHVDTFCSRCEPRLTVPRHCFYSLADPETVSAPGRPRATAYPEWLDEERNFHTGIASPGSHPPLKGSLTIPISENRRSLDAPPARSPSDAKRMSRQQYKAVRAALGIACPVRWGIRAIIANVWCSRRSFAAPPKRALPLKSGQDSTMK